MTTASLFDRARAAIAAHGFDPDMQTRITLFVGTAKNVNLSLLGVSELLPPAGVVYPFVHGQYFREGEFSTLLARVTRWSANPLIYAQANPVVGPLWNEYWRVQGLLGTMIDPRAAYRGLAYGHALLARVRLAPVIPADADELDPYVAALRRIEQENGRMLQTQIRLLKDAPVELTIEERERVVEEEQAIVDQAFTRFLEWLAAA